MSAGAGRTTTTRCRRRANEGIVFRQGRLWRWNAKEMHVVSAWPDIAGKKRILGADWQETPPELPSRFLTLNCPQIVLDEFRASEERVTEERLDDIGWTDAMNDATIREERRRAEGFASLDEAMAALEFSRRIPDEPLSLAAAYRDNNFAVLEALCHVEGMAERIRENPALALGLIRADQFSALNYRDRFARLKKLVHLKQKTTLSLLGFPANEKTAKILRKIDVSAATVANLRWLRTWLVDGAFAKTLAHRPAISSGDLRSLRGAYDLLSPRLLRELLADLTDRRRNLVMDLIEDSRRMAEELDAPWPPRSRFEGLQSLRRFHDELAARSRAKANAEYLHQRFPPPPLPASEGIEPVCSGEELLREADEMKHCVVSYARSIVLGNYYVYRITGDGRATLGVFKERANDGSQRSRWRFGQLYGKANTEVSLATEAMVRSWLDSSLQSVDSIFD